MTPAALLESGLLDLYVLGQCSGDEAMMVEDMAAQYAEVSQAIDTAAAAIENYAATHAVAPPPALKPFVLATLNFMGRLERGEQPSDPPLISDASTVADYEEWLNRPDLQLETELEDAFAYIIAATPKATTAIVWLSKGAMPEIHHDEHEKFLVVEGTCCITIEGTEHYLSAGSVLSIPLYADHFVQVTSDIPCKVILQRIAA
jgi:mannose-6-phosphate isomerase-like protein (cupin superfamily)